MKSTSPIGLCLVTACAIGAVAAASASAASPEYRECVAVAKGTGEYIDSKCKKPGKGVKSNWSAVPISKTFPLKAKSGNAKLFAPNRTIACASSTGSGEEAPPSLVKNLVVTFVKCTTKGIPCTSKGAPTGTIVTSPLGGPLGFISKAKVEVGQDLEAEGEQPYAAFECGGLAIVTTGSVIAKITGNINVFSTKSTATFAVTEEHTQEPERFEGGPKATLSATLNGEGPFPAALEHKPGPWFYGIPLELRSPH
jgi:hypothetical protein